MKGFQPSKEWRVYERNAQKRWKENESIADMVKWILIPVIIVSLCWLIVRTLIATYYIVMYVLANWR